MPEEKPAKDTSAAPETEVAPVPVTQEAPEPAPVRTRAGFGGHPVAIED